MTTYMIEPGDWESATGECLPLGSNGVMVRKVEVGLYESEDHKDCCALIGLLISQTLDMHDALPKEIEERVNAMKTGLQIIATWASCDSIIVQTRIEAMEDIQQLAVRSLGKAIKSA